MVCSFFAFHEVVNRDKLEKCLEDRIKDLVYNGMITSFNAWSKNEFEDIGINVAKRLREEISDITIFEIMDNSYYTCAMLPPIDIKNMKLFSRDLPLTNEIEEQFMLKKVKHNIDISDYCIFYFDEAYSIRENIQYIDYKYIVNPTAYAMKYAKESKKKIFVIYQ